MLRLIRRSFFVFFLFLPLLGFSQNIEYNRYNYTPTFLDRIRQIGFWFYYQARLAGIGDTIHVPIRVKVQEAYDFIFISLFSSVTAKSPTDLIVLQSNQYCPYNCSVCGSNGGYSVTFFGCQNRSDPVIDDNYLCRKDGVTCCPIDNSWNYGYFVDVRYHEYCGNYYWDTLHYLLNGVSGADLPTGSGWVRFRDGSIRTFRVFSYSGRMRQNFSERVSRNLPNIGGGVLYDPPNASVVIQKLSEVGMSTASLATQPGFSDFLDYFGRGKYIDGSNGVVSVSTSPYTVPISTFSQVISNIFVSSVVVSTLIVNVEIDLSTTNTLLRDIRSGVDVTTNILSRMEEYISSEVYISSVGLPSQVFDTLYQTSTTIFGIYQDFLDFFRVRFGSDTWDCVVRFGSFSFLGAPIVLSDVGMIEPLWN